MNRTARFVLRRLQRSLVDGSLAGLLSAGMLAWRGKRDTGHALATINAPSHLVHGEEAFAHVEPSARHTLTGAALHAGSSVFWAAIYEALQARRARPSAARSLADAVAVAGLAAVVDLKLAPERLKPGFERRLSRSNLLLVYATFAAGLALGGVLSRPRD